MRNLKIDTSLCSTEPHPKPLKMPEEGERVLALYKGEWIVLEVAVEHPTYEESFTAFKYWIEPFCEMLEIDPYDISQWQPLPENNDG